MSSPQHLFSPLSVGLGGGAREWMLRSRLVQGLAGAEGPEARVINIERGGFQCGLEQLQWLRCHTISPQH